MFNTLIQTLRNQTRFEKKRELKNEPGLHGASWFMRFVQNRKDEKNSTLCVRMKKKY